jgi:periplasmic protein TonB
VANGVAPVGQHPHAPLVGAAAAVTLHLFLGLGLLWAPKVALYSDRAAPVEVDLVTPKPPEPAPPPPPPPDPAPPPPDVAPKHLVRKVVLQKTPPPMPNQEPKPQAPTEDPPTPVFGVTQDSVVEGDSVVAVPVGNTLMTKDRTVAKAPPPPLPPAPPPPPVFNPVDEESVAELPEKLSMPIPAYPEMARRLGVEGKVRLRLGIDRSGHVKAVRALQKVGYGMDEAAEAAAWQSRWKPARLENGQPVDVVIHYNFTFQLPTR